jgi:hypothetical protein
MKLRLPDFLTVAQELKERGTGNGSGGGGKNY